MFVFYLECGDVVYKDGLPEVFMELLHMRRGGAICGGWLVTKLGVLAWRTHIMV